MQSYKCFYAFVFCLSAVLCGATDANLDWKARWRPAPSNQSDLLAAHGLQNLRKYQTGGHSQGNCSLATASRRKEWTSMLPREREAYTNAVLCLMKKPSRLAALDPSLAPGAKSRYDDFVAVHVNNTFSIHATANFLSWHRYFTWAYEFALRSECGYKGAQPYWNWAITALDPINSPMFDGSPSSMGGNGIYAAHNCTNALASTANPPVGCIPPGEGGGCVQTGPFKNMTVNIAPVAPSLQVPASDVPTTQPFLSYFPRCLRRDVSPWVSSNWTRDVDVYDLITQNKDIYWFQTMMQGNGFLDGFFGVHAGGHYTIGGDPGGDFFASPGDPAFFLHHAQIDRVWWIWQNQDLANRQNAISGTITLFDTPPSRNGTLDDLLDVGILGDPLAIRDAMNTVDGKFCYVYV